MRDRFIGLDVHKATIAVAIAEDGRAGEIRHYGTIQHRPEHIAKLMKRLAAKGAGLHFCYEAGPWLWPASPDHRSRPYLHRRGAECLAG